MSLPARGVWIEINLSQQDNRYRESLPARGVWIEIHLIVFFAYFVSLVTPREGSVD